MTAIVYINSSTARKFHCNGKSLDSETWDILDGFVTGLKDKYIAEGFSEVSIPTDVREKIDREQVYCLVKINTNEMNAESVLLSVKFVND